MTDGRAATTAAASDLPVVVIGAGPAGLTAAFELSRRGAPVVVFESDRQVGGLARTVEHEGFRFDIGGHRFYTKIPVVRQLWQTMLGPDFLSRPRLSRIFYRGRFFRYPLQPIDVVRNLGVGTSLAIFGSYIAARLRPIRNEISFADWVINRFGNRLYHVFFKTYTQKVWGIPCEQISSEWAAQRIKGLSARTAIMSMLGWRPAAGGAIKTLIDRFEYPRLGPGMMWERFAEAIARQGGRVELETRVTRLIHEGNRITGVEVASGGATRYVPAAHVISTMAVPHLVEALAPEVPASVREQAGLLRHRGFLTVALLIDQREVFPDNWIYIHDEAVRVGRIQNYKNWSPEMVPDPAWTCLGLEYFCSPGDECWEMSDERLIAFATEELARIGIAPAERVRGGVVVRVENAYPVYDLGYRSVLLALRQHLDRFENLQLVGRNGMHKYNNQDHSMFTALLAVSNFFGASHDLWSVNADDEYFEEGDEGTGDPAIRALAQSQPLVPMPLGAGRPGQTGLDG